MIQQHPIRALDELRCELREESDDQLIQAARAGCGQAFAALIGRYCSMVRKTIYRILRHQEDTEDVLQDTLLKAFNRLDQFRGSSSFSTWLTRIAINSSLMLLRKKKVRVEASYDWPNDENSGWKIWDFPDPALDPENLYARQQKNDLLRSAVQRLPESFRTIVSHYHGQECTLQETAEAHSISVAAAKSRLLRARIRLRSSLERKNLSIADARQGKFRD